jgi:hypothetical protein
MSTHATHATHATHSIGKHVYVVGKCKQYLKKDLQDMAEHLKLSFKKKATNAELCSLLDQHFQSKPKTPPPPSTATTLAPATLAVIAAKAQKNAPRLEPHKLHYKGKVYDLKDCKKSLAKITKPELLTIFDRLKLVPSSKSSTKETLCLELRKASLVVAAAQAPAPTVQVQQQVQAPTVQVQQQVQIQVQQAPKGQIMLDGQPLSLKNCASFEEPVLRALVKALHTSYVKDKSVLCKRIQKKFDASSKTVIQLKSSEFVKTKPTKTKPPKATTPAKAATPKPTTPAKVATPKPTTPSQAPLLPASLKPMTAEEIREAVRKCLHLTK